MRIVQVLYSGLGGHGTVAFSLLDQFHKENVANYLVFYGIENVNEHYKNTLKNEGNVKDYYAVIKKEKKNFMYWKAYYKYLKKIKPDTILLHSNQLILITKLYSLLNSTQIISVEHDSLSDRNKRKWIVSNLNALFANKVVVLHENYKEVVKQHLWFKSLIKKYVVIPNGIDPSKYSPREKKTETAQLTLFMASRMNRLRDHITLIEAVKLVHHKYKNIQLRIAGDGDTLQTLKKKYIDLDFVQFLGNISENKIIHELQNTDIYIHATFAETFSTAILQAMSCGLPIITSDIEGTKHMIHHKKNGLTYKNNEVKDLASNIEFLIKNSEYAVSLGKNARNDVLNNYNIVGIAQKYLALIIK